MNEKAAVPALDTPLSAPSGPGGQHWQARTLSNDPKRDNIDPDRLVIRWMSAGYSQEKGFAVVAETRRKWSAVAHGKSSHVAHKHDGSRFSHCQLLQIGL